MIAHQFGHTAIFDLLMQRSAPWVRLVQAAVVGDKSLLQRILQQQPALFARLSSNAARRIVRVAVRNNTRALELLLGDGWPANATLENNQTALHYAAWHGNLAMVRALLNRGADVNVFETQHIGSPLGWALHGSLHGWHRDKGDYPAVTRMLLEAGAEIPKLDTRLMRLMMCLSSFGNILVELWKEAPLTEARIVSLSKREVHGEKTHPYHPYRYPANWR
jgi:hypothetical protein